MFTGRSEHGYTDLGYRDVLGDAAIGGLAASRTQQSQLPLGEAMTNNIDTGRNIADDNAAV